MAAVDDRDRGVAVVEKARANRNAVVVDRPRPPRLFILSRRKRKVVAVKRIRRTAVEECFLVVVVVDAAAMNMLRDRCWGLWSNRLLIIIIVC